MTTPTPTCANAAADIDSITSANSTVRMKRIYIVLPLGPIIPRFPRVAPLLRVAWIERLPVSTDNASCSQIAQAARCGSWEWRIVRRRAQEAAKIRTKTGLKSIVSLILDRIAAASRGPNKSPLHQGWIRRQCFAIRLKTEFCWKIDVGALSQQSQNSKGQ